MSLSLQNDSILRDGAAVGRVEKRGRRWWWFCRDAQGDEATRGMVLQVVRIFLRSREASPCP